MDNEIRDTILLLGATALEARFYLASFKLGSATMSEIATKARLKRSTAYVVGNQLIKKELLFEDHSQYKKQFTAAEPETLIRLLASKQRSIGRKEMSLKEKLPELRAAYQASESLPNVRMYKGNSGLLAVQRDILSAKTDILLWSNQATESLFFSRTYHDQFIQERIKKGVIIRVLAVANDEAKQLQKYDANALRETRLLPEGTTFRAETYIYDNKIAVLDYTTDIMGVIVESTEIANTQRSIFLMNWDKKLTL